MGLTTAIIVCVCAEDDAGRKIGRKASTDLYTNSDTNLFDILELLLTASYRILYNNKQYLETHFIGWFIPLILPVFTYTCNSILNYLISLSIYVSRKARQHKKKRAKQ